MDELATSKYNSVASRVVEVLESINVEERPKKVPQLHNFIRPLCKAVNVADIADCVSRAKTVIPTGKHIKIPVQDSGVVELSLKELDKAIFSQAEQRSRSLNRFKYVISDEDVGYCDNIAAQVTRWASVTRHRVNADATTEATKAFCLEAQLSPDTLIEGLATCGFITLDGADDKITYTDSSADVLASLANLQTHFETDCAENLWAVTANRRIAYSMHINKENKRLCKKYERKLRMYRVMRLFQEKDNAMGISVPDVDTLQLLPHKLTPELTSALLLLDRQGQSRPKTAGSLRNALRPVCRVLYFMSAMHCICKADTKITVKVPQSRMNRRKNDNSGKYTKRIASGSTSDSYVYTPDENHRIMTGKFEKKVSITLENMLEIPNVQKNKPKTKGSSIKHVKSLQLKDVLMSAAEKEAKHFSSSIILAESILQEAFYVEFCRWLDEFDTAPDKASLPSEDKKLPSQQELAQKLVRMSIKRHTTPVETIVDILKNENYLTIENATITYTGVEDATAVFKKLWDADVEAFLGVFSKGKENGTKVPPPVIKDLVDPNNERVPIDLPLDEIVERFSVRGRRRHPQKRGRTPHSAAKRPRLSHTGRTSTRGMTIYAGLQAIRNVRHTRWDRSPSSDSWSRGSSTPSFDSSTRHLFWDRTPSGDSMGELSNDSE